MNLSGRERTKIAHHFGAMALLKLKLSLLVWLVERPVEAKKEKLVERGKQEVKQGMVLEEKEEQEEEEEVEEEKEVDRDEERTVE